MIRALELRSFGRKSEKYNPEEDKQNRLFDETEDHGQEAASPVVEAVKVPWAAVGFPARKLIHRFTL